MAAAKKEGKVVWYCSVPVATAQKVANMFEQKTGIKVELFRSGGSNILRRFQQEGDSGKVFVDVLTHSEPAAASAMTKKGLFVPFKATDFDKVPDAVKDPNGNPCRAAPQRDGDLCARRSAAGGRPAQDLDRSLQPEIQGQDGDGGPVVLVAAGGDHRHAGADARLEIFRGAAQERHHDGAEQPAGLRHDQARRAHHRGGRRRRLCRRRPPAGHEDLDALSRGRHLRDRVAELGGEGLAQSERGQGVRRVHARAAPCRSCSRSEFLYSARTDVAGPARLSAALLAQDVSRSTTTTSRRKARASASGSRR